MSALAPVPSWRTPALACPGRQRRVCRRHCKLPIQLQTWKHASANSRLNRPEVCVTFALLKRRGRRESRVPIAPMGPVQRKHGSRTTGEPETSRLSLRDGFTVSFALSPVTGLFCHRRLADHSEKLDASVGASGPHDFAVRKKPRSSVVATASTASHRTFVTIASRPSFG